MFWCHEVYVRLVGLFDWGNARTQIFSVSRNRYSFTLAGYRNGKSGTAPALVLFVLLYLQVDSHYCPNCLDHLPVAEAHSKFNRYLL